MSPADVVATTGFGATDAVLIVVIVVLVVLSGLFALAETGMTRTSKAAARAFLDQGRRGARPLSRLVEHPQRFLNPILLLTLLCQLVAATLVGVVANDLFGAIGVAVAAAVEVAVIFVLGEAAPKNWAVQHPDRAALFSAPYVNILTRFLPIRLVSAALVALSRLILPGGGQPGRPDVSEAELLAMADVAAEEDVIETEERALIRSIIDFGDTVAREVMVPRPDMVAVEAGQRAADVLEVAMGAGYSRIPVYESQIDNVAGIAYTKDLMRADLSERGDVEVRALVREAHFVPETKPVSDLMREMQDQKFHMAIVVDEYGGTAGLVTLEDLIEELVGEIVDEFDVEEPLMEPLADGSYRVNARMQLDELNELLHATLPAGDWDTVGGLVYNLLGHVPVEGESTEADGYRLVAEKVQGRRIGRVRIARTAPQEDAADRRVEPRAGASGDRRG
jgi:CBS domain containing-hemolysin-like protein